MSRFRALAALPVAAFACLGLSGCGLQPLYAGGNRGSVAQSLHAIQVGPIPNRSGWLVRNALVDRLGGESAAPAWRLDVELDDQITGFGIRGDSATTRERRTIRARYRLIAIPTGAIVLDATAGSDTGIDNVGSEYATVAAEQTSAEWLSGVVADQIVARLGQYMARRSPAQ